MPEFISVDQLFVSKLNARHDDVGMDTEEGTELITSVGANHVLQSLLIRPSERKTKDGRPMYEILDGQRRWIAAQRAGIKMLPTELTLETDEALLIRTSVELGRHQKRLSNQNLAEKIRHLMGLKDEAGQTRFPTQAEAASFLGLSQARVSVVLATMDVPEEVKRLQGEGKLSAKAVEKIAQGFASPSEQVAAARLAAEHGETQATQLDAVLAAREEPSLLSEPDHDTRARGVARASRTRKAKTPTKGPEARGITSQERARFELMIRQSPLSDAEKEHYLGLMRDLPDGRLEAFLANAQAATRRIQEVAAHENEEAPRQAPPPNPEAIQAALERQSAPTGVGTTFVTPEEATAVREAIRAMRVEIDLTPDEHLSLSASDVPGLEEFLLPALVKHLRATTFFQTHLQARADAQPESYAILEH